jgi:hypothetical protein
VPTRRQATAFFAAALLAVLTMGQDDCSTSTTDSPDKDSGSEGSKQPRSKVGDSITLEGTDTKMKVKLLGVDRNLSAGEIDEPQRGRKYVGVRVRLTNVGDATYDDSPSNGAKLITNKDEQADTTILTGGDCASSFASDTTISPGSSQQGCLPFEIKKKAKPKAFQFSLDSGFGPETGEWSVR